MRSWGRRARVGAPAAASLMDEGSAGGRGVRHLDPAPPASGGLGAGPQLPASALKVLILPCAEGEAGAAWPRVPGWGWGPIA